MERFKICNTFHTTNRLCFNFFKGRLQQQYKQCSGGSKGEAIRPWPPNPAMAPIQSDSLTGWGP